MMHPLHRWRYRRWHLTRYWHSWGRLWWYLGTNTKGASYGWRWFRPSKECRGTKRANLGQLHVVWHGKAKGR